jgi:PAS domain-containing protein
MGRVPDSQRKRFGMGFARMERRGGSRRRIWAYWLVGLGLGLVYVALRGSAWQGSVALHTLMEVAATLLAAVVGAMALVRFYSAKGNTFLFVGTGFLGAALLDGYHALVTSVWFAPYLPSDLPSLIPWSWIASRLFLSLMLALSWLAWMRERRLGAAGRIGEGAVYLGAGLLTLASFLFFAFAPLPHAYYPELVFHRPEELAPALLFLVALVGYLRKGDWRHDPFEHWLVLALIVGLVAQAAFMSFSGRLFDMEFDAAHLLKKVSYVCVLTGLLVSMLAIHRRAEERGARIRAVVDNAADGIITIDARGTILSFNPAATALFGLAAGDAIGRNVVVTRFPAFSVNGGAKMVQRAA